jgi:hypothetical protein
LLTEFVLDFAHPDSEVAHLIYDFLAPGHFIEERRDQFIDSFELHNPLLHHVLKREGPLDACLLALVD